MNRDRRRWRDGKGEREKGGGGGVIALLFELILNIN